jgi:hypothetical protein
LQEEILKQLEELRESDRKTNEMLNRIKKRRQLPKPPVNLTQTQTETNTESTTAQKPFKSRQISTNTASSVANVPFTKTESTVVFNKSKSTASVMASDKDGENGSANVKTKKIEKGFEVKSRTFNLPLMSSQKLTYPETINTESTLLVDMPQHMQNLKDIMVLRETMMRMIVEIREREKLSFRDLEAELQTIKPGNKFDTEDDTASTV